MNKALVIVLLLLGLIGCAVPPVTFEQDDYASLSKQHLAAIKMWRFEGRMAITGPSDSWTANVKWQHKPGLDRVNLSGLLGQGATVIELNDEWVTIDDGKGPIAQSNDPDEFVSEKLGVFVPVRSLVSWVVGLPDKQKKVVATAQGFDQDGWQVVYKEWLKLNEVAMPHKVNVNNDKVKLKLVIEKWETANE